MCSNYQMEEVILWDWYKLKALSSSEKSDPAVLLIWFHSPLSLLQKISFNQFVETPWFLQHHSFCSQGWLYHVHSEYFSAIPLCHFLSKLAVLFLLFPKENKMTVMSLFSPVPPHLPLTVQAINQCLNNLETLETKKTKKKSKLSLLTGTYASLKLLLAWDLLRERQYKLSLYNLAIARSWLHWQGQVGRGNFAFSLHFLCTVRYKEGSINLIMSEPQSTWKEGNYI